MKRKSIVRLAGFVLGMELLGLISGWLSGDMKEAYASLSLPPLAPPGWLFGVIWPILYALLGIAAYLVHRENDASSRNGLFWFAVQAALNFIWPIIFFRFDLYWAALVVIIALIFVAGYTTRLFFRINPTAGWLMLPYLLWIIFAAYLNFGVAVLN